MTDTARMFDPLDPDDPEDQPTSDPGWTAIMPVPDGVELIIPRHPAGKPSAHWVYRNAKSEMLFAKVRFDMADGSKQVLPLTYGREAGSTPQWRWKGAPTPRPLYGLDRLAARPDAAVLVVEGEKAADAASLVFPDMVVITSPDGAGAADKADWSPLAGRRVTIWPDNDPEGLNYAESVARPAYAAGATTVSCVTIPDSFPAKWDLADAMPEGITPADLQAMLDGAESVDARDARDANGGHSGDCKTEILVDRANPDRTVAALRDVLAERAADLYDRGGPVRLTFDQAAGTHLARPLTPDGLIMEAHQVCRPIRMGRDGLEDATLPPNMARMYLQWYGEWRLRLLNGMTTAPLLREDGSIFSGEGYDAITGMWQQRVPEITIPEHPTRDQAQAALQLLRQMLRTFCFDDAVTVLEAGTSTPVVDGSLPPGKDESAFLNALLTAVVRASVPLAPGIMISAAPVSGAGAGKGLLARLLSSVAFGHTPHAVTAGGSAEELEKRIAAELVAGSPVVFLDNLNAMSVKSDQLASAITERPARVRILGKTETATLNSSALIILTGNGLNVSEDLARRFLYIELDPRTEDPEARQFVGDLLAEVQARRTELLGALLTIWRWGRNEAALPVGRPMGSFDTWSRWVRDPLLALGCQDPADRIREAKDHDSRRQDMVEMFDTWFSNHGNRPVTEKILADEVKNMLDPQDRGRQYRAARLNRLTGTRVGGYVLTRQEPAGKRGASTYALLETGDDRHPGHPGHNTSDDGNSAAAAAATGWKTRI